MADCRRSDRNAITLESGGQSNDRNCVITYALKDPRTSPAKPFYIGKGTDVRAWEHLANADDSGKGQRVAQTRSAGKEVLVSKLADGLSELQALKLEAELISAFGTEDASGKRAVSGRWVCLTMNRWVVCE